jgi:hypothetical protein
VVDGNFTAEHMHMRNPSDDVELTNGTGYFVQRAPYEEHIKEAVEVKQVQHSFVVVLGSKLKLALEIIMFQTQSSVPEQCK